VSRIVDLGTGETVAKLEALSPAHPPWWRRGLDDRDPTSGMFLDRDGRLVRVDFATGARQVLAGPGATPGERLLRF
jgi:hypothetical protein